MDSTYKYPIGALANVFPDMDENIFAGLVRSIREDGLRDPILVWRGEVVDGRTGTGHVWRPAWNPGSNAFPTTPTPCLSS